VVVVNESLKLVVVTPTHYRHLEVNFGFGFYAGKYLGAVETPANQECLINRKNVWRPLVSVVPSLHIYHHTILHIFPCDP